MPHLPESEMKHFTAFPTVAEEAASKARGDDRWENEGGSLHGPPDLKALGITALMTEKYVVGGYTYTKLADAMAQGRRLQNRARS